MDTQLSDWSSPPGCRGVMNYSKCGNPYKRALSIYYWVAFSLYCVMFFFIAGRTLWAFRRRLSSSNGANTKRNGLKLYSFGCLIACALQCVFTYFLTDPSTYGAPGTLIFFCFEAATSLLLICCSLIGLTWAEALNDSSLRISTAFLGKYRRFLFLIIGHAAFVTTPLGIFSSLDIGGNSYQILYRIFCADWAITLWMIGSIFMYYGRKMQQRLRMMQLTEAYTRIRRVTFLLGAAASVAGLFSLLQAIIQHLCDEYPLAWFFVYPGYHVTSLMVCAWFIIAKPGKRDFSKRTGSRDTSVDSGALSGMTRSIS
eukprot:TRINITY_DN428_c1_g2_i2.p1 TRINITY_DN428_c1_g2~~TRINITY_DN428_c1_g2_i2.p1  ORF type:complete len:313 (-),score=17.86 TRINITY_DN428_c1_g2_i2:591-1529(-)